MSAREYFVGVSVASRVTLTPSIDLLRSSVKLQVWQFALKAAAVVVILLLDFGVSFGIDCKINFLILW